MTILVDTNVILDLLLKREPYSIAAQTIITKCAEREVIGYLAAHSTQHTAYLTCSIL